MRTFARFCPVVCAALFFCGAAFAPLSAHAQTQVQSGQVLISELRLRGPAGAEDEFVELYNNTDQEIVVQATDTSAGWTVIAVNGQFQALLFTIPNGTRIPARGHLLGANSNGYSLVGYPSGNPSVNTAAAVAPGPFATATPDLTWAFDVPDGSGVALFTTAAPSNINPSTRLDAFGFTSSRALFREGAGFQTIVTADTEHTYYRDLRGGTPRDTNDNAADFLLVGTSINLQITRLGAPAPENLASPVVNNTSIGAALLDPSVGSSTPPNRERRPNFEPNANLGTLRVRRTFTNNTGAPVSRLRFRVVNLTTQGTPASECGGEPCADLRVLSSQDGESAVSGQVVTVRGVRLEEPPAQPAGGGYNSSLSADFITLGTPLPAGESVNIEFKLGVMRTGDFRFYINIEAQNAPPVLTDAVNGPQ